MARRVTVPSHRHGRGIGCGLVRLRRVRGTTNGLRPPAPRPLREDIASTLSRAIAKRKGRTVSDGPVGAKGPRAVRGPNNDLLYGGQAHVARFQVATRACRRSSAVSAHMEMFSKCSLSLEGDTGRIRRHSPDELGYETAAHRTARHGPTRGRCAWGSRGRGFESRQPDKRPGQRVCVRRRTYE